MRPDAYLECDHRKFNFGGLTRANFSTWFLRRAFLIRDSSFTPAPHGVDSVVDRTHVRDVEAEVFAALHRVALSDDMAGDQQRQFRFDRNVKLDDRSHADFQDGFDVHLSLGQADTDRHAKAEDAPQILGDL